MACTDRGGYLAQRPIADAAGRELVDECIEKVLAPVQVRSADHRRGFAALRVP
jgi:hypothetical protein